MDILSVCNAPGNVAGANVDHQSVVDARESLVNNGEIGRIESISVATELIGQLRGVMYDLDLKLLRAGMILPDLPDSPGKLYAAAAQWLDRHPVLCKAEVRDSGQGLHVILRLAEPIVFATAGDRDRWAAIVEVMQAALPIDPDQPGMTAPTRVPGSQNSKNSAVVELFRPGESVTEQDLLSLYSDMCDRPFATVCRILTGSTNLTPCPVCGNPSSCLRTRPRRTLLRFVRPSISRAVI